MKLLLLASDRDVANNVGSVLRNLGVHDLTVHVEMDAFMEQVVSDRPDLVLMELKRVQAEGGHALASADWALRASKTPAILLLGTDQEQDRYLVEMSTEFEHFLEPPFDRQRVSHAIEKVVGIDTWIRVTGPHSAITAGPSRFGAATDTGRPAFEGDGDVRRENTAQFNSGLHEAVSEGAARLRSDQLPFDRDEERTPAGGMASVAGADVHERATGSMPVVPDDGGDDVPSPQPDPTPINLDVSAIASHQTGPVAAPIEIRLPNLRGGNIADVSVPELMHGLAVSRATGVLVIEQSTLRRELVFLDGVPGREHAGTTLVELDRILSAFTWRDGTYAFEARPVAQAQFLAYGNVYELLYGGISRHLGINEAAMLLGPYLKKYPTLTNRVDGLRRITGVAAVLHIIETFTGRAPFEKDMLSAGVPPEEVLHAACFALMAGALTFRDEPSVGAVQVVFRGYDGRDPSETLRSPAARPAPASGRSTRERALVPEAPTGYAQQAPARETGFDQRTPSRARATSAAQVAAEAAATAGMSTAPPRPTVDLRMLWATMSTQSPHELFGVEPGCGPDVVTERFYQMVRDFHPDQFARSPNPDDRALAETIFLHIRTMYSRLHEQERANAGRATTRRATIAETAMSVPESSARVATVPPRNASSGARVTTVPRSGDSSARISTIPRSSTTQSGSSTAARGDTTPVPGQGRVERPRRTITNPGTLSPEDAAAAAAEVRRRRSARRNTTGGRSTVADAVVQHLRQTGQHGAVTGPAPDGTPAPGDGSSRGFTRRSTLTTPLPTVGALSPAQLVRNAHKAMVSGAHQKAADLIALARARGAEGPVVEAYAAYLDYALDRVSAEASCRLLGELVEAADDGTNVERAQIYVFWGHVLRIDEEEDEASKKYQSAMMLDGANAEASRWHRHLKMRSGKKSKSNSFLDKLLNTKITFTGNKK